MTKLYIDLFIMSLVTAILYILLIFFNKITMQHFKISWHYYTYVMLYSFLVLPYYKLMPLIGCLFPKQDASN